MFQPRTLIGLDRNGSRTLKQRGPANQRSLAPGFLIITFPRKPAGRVSTFSPETTHSKVKRGLRCPAWVDEGKKPHLVVKPLILQWIIQRTKSAEWRRIGLVAVWGATLLPGVGLAQGPGFLFGQPRAHLGARVGYSIPALDSDLFDFTRERFMLEDGGFRSPYFGGEFAIRVVDRLDFAIDLGWTRSRRRSEYRDWEDPDGLPIEQETTFERMSLTFGARYYLTERGRSVGQLAWIPNRIVPYVGGGFGTMWHDFIQEGDFVDLDTLDIFFDRLQASGSAWIADVRGGADFSLSRRVVLTGEARYNFGSGPTGGDYVGFADTDLTGLTLAFGAGFRF